MTRRSGSNLDEPPCLLFAGLPRSCGSEAALAHLKSLERLGRAADVSRTIREEGAIAQGSRLAFANVVAHVKESTQRAGNAQSRKDSEVQEFARRFSETLFEFTHEWVNSARLCTFPREGFQELALALFDENRAEPRSLAELVSALPEEDLDYWAIRPLASPGSQKRLKELDGMAILAGVGELLWMPWSFLGGVTLERPYGDQYAEALKAIDPLVRLKWALAEQIGSMDDEYQDRLLRLRSLVALTL